MHWTRLPAAVLRALRLIAILHPPCAGFYFGCWPHTLFSASWGRQDLVQGIGLTWIQTKAVDKTEILTLTEDGMTAWYKYATYCSTSSYPKLAQQAGCVFGLSTMFAQFLSTGASKIPGSGAMSWDLEAFVLPSEAVLAGHKDLNGWKRPTKVREYGADGGRVVSTAELTSAMCELATSNSSFFALLPCLFGGVLLDPYVYTHSTAYKTLPFRLDADPYAGAYGDDGETEQKSAEGATLNYDAQFWESGVDKQLAFLSELQTSAPLRGTRTVTVRHVNYSTYALPFA